MAVALTKEPLWFLDTLVRFPVSSNDGDDGISLMESYAPHGDSPPFHIHETEDELFHVVSGEFRFCVGDEDVRLFAGDSILAPKGVPHTYRIESEEGGRWLVVTTRGDFERFVRSFSRPAERDDLPERSGPPTPEQANALAAACREHGIEIVGRPLA